MEYVDWETYGYASETVASRLRPPRAKGGGGRVRAVRADNLDIRDATATDLPIVCALASEESGRRRRHARARIKGGISRMRQGQNRWIQRTREISKGEEQRG